MAWAPVEQAVFETPVSRADYAAVVAKAKDYIAAGDIFQVVASHRFRAPYTQSPLALYRSLRRTNPSGRLVPVLCGAVLPVPFLVIGFTASAPLTLYLCLFASQYLASWGLGSAAAATQDLVLPRMRGTATATFFIGTTLLGLALGPYLAGRISTLSGSLSTGMLSLLLSVPLTVAAGLVAYRRFPAAERSREERARAAGEPI